MLPAAMQESPLIHECTPPRKLSKALSFPRLDIAATDLVPFSDAFPGMLFSTRSSPGKVREALRDFDISYDIENLTGSKELVSQWLDDDIDEILVMSRKQPCRTLPTIAEDIFESSPTLNETSLKLTDFDYVATESGYSAPTICRRRDTNQIFEIKVFRGAERHSRNYQYVLNAVSELCSPFLPRIHWSFKEHDTIYMILDWQTGQSISDLLSIAGPFEIRRVVGYASEMVEALSHLHEARLVHRNLAPDTVVINTHGHITITNFGCAMPVGGAQYLTEGLHSDGQLHGHLAPELRLGWNHDFLVDCWGFGLVLYYMLHGKHPHASDAWDPENKPSSICSKVAHTRVHVLGSDLAKKCLESNPSLRLALDGIRQHPFFNSIDWNRVSRDMSNVPALLEPALIEDHRRSRRSVDMVSSITEQNRHALQQSFASSSNNDLSNADSIPMSTLLDEFPKVQPHQPNDPAAGQPAHSDIQAQQSGISPEERMARFWDSLDSEEQSHPVPTKISYAEAVSAYCSRPLKLRKQRSSVTLDKRMSTFSTASHGNLRKRISSIGKPMPTFKHLEAPELPKGLEQIGNGIGYTYNIPAATLSKATICGQTPKARARYSAFRPVSFNFNLGFVNGLWRNDKGKPKKTCNITVPAKPKDGNENKSKAEFVTAASTTVQQERVAAPSLDGEQDRPQDANFLRQIYGDSSNLSLGLLMSPSSTIVVSPSMAIGTMGAPTEPAELGALLPDAPTIDVRKKMPGNDSHGGVPGQEVASSELNTIGKLEGAAHEAKEGDPKCTVRLIPSPGLRPSA